MLTIRLIRTGKKNAPSFRIVLLEKKSPPKSGKFLEILGNYNSRSKEINLKKERIEYWLSQGVQTSETVHNLLVKEGVIKGPKIKKKIKIKKKKAQASEDAGVSIPEDVGEKEKVDKSTEKSKIKEE